MTRPSHYRGSAALISVLILAVLLTSLALTSGLRSIFYYVDERHTEDHEYSLVLARSCAVVALQEIVTDPSYVPFHEKVDVTSQEVCEIDTISSTTSLLTITTHAMEHNSLAILQTIIQLPIVGRPILISQSETTSIPP